MTTPARLNEVTGSRLRLTQRLLVAASDLDPQLLKDEHWQKAMLCVAQLLARDARGRALKVNVIRELQSLNLQVSTP